MDLAWVAQMDPGTSSSKDENLKGPRPCPDSRPSRQGIGKTGEHREQCLMAAHTKLSVPFQTVFFLVDPLKVIPDAPRVWKAERSEAAEKVQVGFLRGSADSYTWSFIDDHRGSEKVATHGGGESSVSITSDRLITAPHFELWSGG